MENDFSEDERLLRAVFPASIKPFLWKNKRLSSAAFKDSAGLSVDRTGDRLIKESVNAMRARLHGFIVSVTVSDCHQVNAVVKYKPSQKNLYHSEIHANEETICLEEEQALWLARAARIEYDPHN